MLIYMGILFCQVVSFMDRILSFHLLLSSKIFRISWNFRNILRTNIRYLVKLTAKQRLLEFISKFRKESTHWLAKIALDSFTLMLKRVLNNSFDLVIGNSLENSSFQPFLKNVRRIFQMISLTNLNFSLKTTIKMTFFMTCKLT